MKLNNIPEGYVCLADQREYISSTLKLTPYSKEDWRVYRFEIQAGLKNKTLEGIKEGKWYISKDDLEKFLKQKMAELVSIKPTLKRQTLKNVEQVKKIIEDMTSVGVDSNKILALLQQKLGITKSNEIKDAD